jgi:Domain of unknown function (DUF4349)
MARHRWFAAGSIVAVALVVAACASSAVRQGEGPGQPLALPSAAAAAAAPASAFRAADNTGSTVTAGSGSGESVNAAPAPDQALIVRTGSMVLDVTDLDAALAKAQAAVGAVGGYVSGSDRSGQGDQQVASITYRIPAAGWDRALDGVRAAGTRVEKEQTGAVEVTGQVMDLGARISNLKVTEAALQGIMAKATKIPDVLDVQQQLTSVQGQIEQLTTEKQHLEQQAALGTLTVVFQVPIVAVTTATAGWNPGAQVDQATAQLIEVGQGIVSIVIWLGIVGVPVLLIVLLVALPATWIARRMLGRVRPAGPGEPMWGPGATPSA